MRILVIGDVIGKPGRKALSKLLPGLCLTSNIDLIIANGENSAGGVGLTPSTAEELFNSGVNVITSGNHIWAHKEIYPYLNEDMAILRPLNYPPATIGRGYCLHRGVLIINLIGRTFIGNFDCPFRAMDQLLQDFDNTVKVIIVDFHAEATSEKVAMGRYLDGRVSAVLGTHTHVGTIDAQILPRGTAYVTDIGMVGPIKSIIGDDISGVLDRFLTQINKRLTVGSGDVEFNAILLDIDENSGRALDIQRIKRIAQ